MATNLLSRSEYKQYIGIDADDTRQDSRIDLLLPAVTRLVESYTDRDFEVATGVATARTYQYDGDGFLDIDDCVAISSVATDAGVVGESYPLESVEWTAQPSRGETYYYLLVHGQRFPFSPEMGFARNLDTLDVGYKPVTVTVTAQWGWPSVPEDVKLAAAWVIQASLTKPSNDDLAAEAIAGYSRSWVRGNQMPEALGIPNRARDLLSNYIRMYA